MVTSTLGGLRAACGDVTEAGADDTVDGVPARWVAWPGSNEEVSAVLRAAAELGLRSVARGTGSRLAWGAPPTALDLIVDTSRMGAVLAHAAGDLVVTVQAGLRMADLQDALAPHRQRLALDNGDTAGGPVAGGTVGDTAGGTVGGTIATAASGPLRYRYGSVRDLLIGITVVLADGTLTRSGGTVVKNVAGYDLGKLYTGSLGTLGVITEAVFRLHPLPEASRWITVPASDAERAAAAIAAIRASQLDPVALEVDRAAPGAPVTVGVAVEGVAGGIGTRADAVADLLGEAAGASAAVTEQPPGWWGRPPHPPQGPAAVITCEPTGLADLLTTGLGALRGSAGAGVLIAGLDDGDRLGAQLAQLRGIATRHGGSAVLRCAPPHRRTGLDVWGPVPALALMRRLKDQFDPEHRLAPGRFVGGI
ncbi:MAG: FAD-binding oxidoreductase [Pseudonocardiales bacterium]|nr:FAD-binding oxidoreductase [Pseudonocardiales bacterium]MBV9031851.1 FAD-binding oxidoreductase [Pseudonocardiales bacterium]MBW0009664.1 FAD-binding oxidoreductase [Pseudonocardiales bacterium]